jgi:hypothetical protein
MVDAHFESGGSTPGDCDTGNTGNTGTKTGRCQHIARPIACRERIPRLDA